MVYLSGPGLKPDWIGEIKWSDRLSSAYAEETKALSAFLRKQKSINSCFITTRTLRKGSLLEGRPFTIIPTAAYCYTVGRNITAQLSSLDPLRSAKGRPDKDEESAPADDA